MEGPDPKAHVPGYQTNAWWSKNPPAWLSGPGNMFCCECLRKNPTSPAWPRLAAGSVPSFPGRPSRSCRNTSWPSWGAGASGPSVGAGQLLWASSSPSEGPSLHDLSGHAPPGKPVGSYSPVSKTCLSGVFSIKKVLPFKDVCIDTEATGWLFPSALWATVGRWWWSPSARVSHGT